MTLQSQISAHYAAKHTLQITAAEHLHIGGASATRHVLSRISFLPEMHVLDIGCGVGGPARTAAAMYGCRITGVDITPEFIDIAREISAILPDSDRLKFQVMNAENLEYTDKSFDGAMMFHTALNIPDKKAVFTECARVLKKGSIFLIYDILALKNAASMSFPMPWADTPRHSFLEPLDSFKRQLEESGFEIESIENSQNYAQAVLQKVAEEEADTITEARLTIMTNLYHNVVKGACAPFIIIARKA